LQITSLLQPLVTLQVAWSPSGLNDEYEVFNKFQSYFRFPDRAYCLKCYGKKQTDWIEIVNGRIDEEMKELIAQHGKMEFDDIEIYLFLIKYGLYRENRKKWFFYKYDSGAWEEMESYIGIDHFKAKKELSFWLKKFINDGYITVNDCDLNDYMRSFHHDDNGYEYAKQIKNYILDSTEMTIEELLKLKEDLSFFGFTIDDLNELEYYDSLDYVLLGDFEFTWNNLVKKFRLPPEHKYFKVPDGVLTFDFET